MDTYFSLAQKRISMALKDSPSTFEELCRKCKGLYPTMITGILNDLDVDKHCVPVYTMDNTKYAMNSENENHCMVTDGLPNNPVLSSWYYSWDTCYKLGNLALWKNKRILFLGSPRLFEYFVSKGLGEELVLVDLDGVVIDALSKRYLANTSAKKIHFFQGDINDFNIPQFTKEHSDLFDSIFLDPPWYPECYAPWLNTALKFVKPTGCIVFSLSPPLLRPTAISERTEILNRSRKIAEMALLLSDLSEYDTPSFEKIELEQAGLKLRRNWKVSDIVVLTGITSNVFSDNVNITKDYLFWKEFDWLNMRWFLDSSRDFSKNLQLIAAPQGIRFLKSPSKRNPQFKEINLLSSHGHGLCVSNPVKFMQIVQKLQHGEPSLSYREIVSNSDIDQPSKQLLYSLEDDS